MKPLVSVIVPVYNVEKYIDKCIESIVWQTYSNLEIILVDDGSTDYCGEKCEQWRKKDERISVIHKKNSGLGFARNTGLEAASGEFVMYIDSDDYIANNMVERLAEVAENTHSDTVYCGLTRVYSDGSELAVPAAYDNQTFEKEEIIDKVLLEMVGSKPEENEDAILYMSVWHALYSMEVLRKNNIRFPSEREIMCEDIIYHIEYLRYAKKVAYIKEPLYFYRVNPKSLSQVYDRTRFERQKVLSREISSRLCEFAPKEKVYLREDRRFLGGVRAQIRAIAASEEKHKLKIIKEMCKDEKVKKVLNRYPYQKNPFKHKMFNIALKNNMAWVLYMLAQAMNRTQQSNT